MESKSINRFHSYCKNLDNLHRSVSANPEEPFVLEATVQMFCLTFDLSWKVNERYSYLCFCDFREKAAEIFAADTDSLNSFQK